MTQPYYGDDGLIKAPPSPIAMEYTVMPTLSRYTVLPFSGVRFNENQNKLREGETPCAICGKAVQAPYKHEAVVVVRCHQARSELARQA